METNPNAGRHCRTCALFQRLYGKSLFSFYKENTGVCKLNDKFIKFTDECCAFWQRRNSSGVVLADFGNAEDDLRILLKIFKDM